MMNSEGLQNYINEYQDSVSQLAGHDLTWLKQTRDQAMTDFANTGLPTLRHEDWKYTKITPIEKRNFQPNFLATTSATACIDGYLLSQDCHVLVFIDGVFDATKSKLLNLPKGCRLGNFATFVNQEPAIIEKYLNQSAKHINHGFAKLNTAFMHEGAVIQLAKNARITQPIHLLFITTEQSANKVNYLRNLIIAEDGSEAEIIEHYIGLGSEDYFNNVITEINCQPKANIKHYKIQQEHNNGFHVATTQVTQQGDSRFNSYLFSFGGRLVRSDLNIALNNEGAECLLHGLYLTDKKQHMDFHTRVDHLKPNGISREFYKGVLADFSRAVFNGKVIVHKDAQKTDSEQNNKNLLLSKTAEIDTKPELEIYADDVKCSHGATVGQLDPNELFYLRARGIDEQTARRLLIHAFASDIIDWLPNQQLQDYLTVLVEAKLATANIEE